MTPRVRPQARLSRPGTGARAALALLLLLSCAAAFAAARATADEGRPPATPASSASSANASRATGDGAHAFAAAALRRQSAERWTRLGPSAGLVADIAVSPSNPSVVYAAVDVESGQFVDGGNGAKTLDGVYKSADGGLTWAATGLLGKTIFSVAVDPADEGTVYAGGFRSGVFRSRDGGRTWDGPHRPPGTQEADAYALAVHPQTRTTVYASFVSFNGGLHRSTDSGLTWGPVPGVGSALLRVSFDPQTPSTIYAAGGSGTTAGVFKSADNGQTWNRAAAGLSTGDITTAVAVDPLNSSVLYVGTFASRVFKSTNGGQSWSELREGLPARAVNDVIVSAANPSVVLAATDRGVYRTADGGQSWAATGLAPTPAASLAAPQSDSTAFLAGTHGLGVFRSTDAGATWSPGAEGLPRPVVKHIAVSTTDPARVYAGTDDGLYETGDRGDTWSAVPVPNPLRRAVLGLAVDPLNPSTLYAGLDFTGLFKSTTGGASWSQVFAANSNFLALAVDPSAPSTLYWSIYPLDLYKTTDGGASRTRLNGRGSTTAIAVDPTNSQIVYAGSDAGLSRSTDGGRTWAPTPLHAPWTQGDFVKSIEIDPRKPSTLYAVLHTVSHDDPDAYRSDDGGRTWRPVFVGAAFPPRSIAVSPGDSDLLFAGTGAGTLRSADGGETFELGDGMMPATVVEALEFDAGGRYLYAGTTDGVYRMQVSPCSYVPLPKSQSFPAAGGQATVQVSIAPACPVTAASTDADWITFTLFTDESPGGRVSYAVAPNAGNRRGAAVRIRNQVFHVTQAAAPASFAFAAAVQSAGEGDAGGAQVTITRQGDNTFAASVSYATVDDQAAVPCDPSATRPDGSPYPRGAAYARCDYATTVDTVFFAAGETSKTVRVPLVDDGHAEGPETFSLALSQPTNGASLGAQSSVTVTIADDDAAGAPNPIHANAFFVRQQYLDFLSREPEQGEPWTGVLERCPDVNNDPDCGRVLVSQSFFQSPEFQLKGFFVYNFYKVAFGRLPLYAEITPDMRGVTGQTPQEVFGKRFAFALAFVERPEFKATYDPMSDAQYVDALAARYALRQITTPSPANPDGTQKVTLTLAEMKTGMATGFYGRAQILRAFVQSDEVNAAEFNRAFVAMQYYGYLRRDPEPTGYQAWLDYLGRNPGDYRTMVNGFVNSPEYVLRFGKR